MPDIVKLLPDHVANQIAAGEVVQRPASVVKELLDNAIDAGSKNIKLIIVEAGKVLIQVVDDGCGLSETDARMCWERHATSKINTVDDLFKLKTMGFRGEALASIASIAWVEMKTKRPEDEIGTFIFIEGSEVKKQENTSTVNGTSISVKNLFYNIPARRNFLKSNAVEYKHILEEFTRAALANAHISFSLHHNQEEQFNLIGGTFEQRILQLFTDKKSQDLLKVEEQTTIINVSGFIGSPQIAKRVRGEQYLFVNNRFVKDPYLNHAINNAYEGLISKEQFPFYCIYIDINPALIDVNIHPTKTEIKFEDDKNVYQIIRAVIKKSLGELMQLPVDDAFDDNNFIHRQISNMGVSSFEPTQNATVKTSSSNSDFGNFKDEYSQSRKKPQNWDLLFKGLDEVDNNREEVQTNYQLPLTNSDDTRRFFQLHNQFIVTQIKSGLMLIDQQAAHERILFERNLAALNNTPIASQQLLFPKTVELTNSDVALLIEILPQIRALGFNINEFGKNTFVINGLPAELHLANEKNLLEEILENYKNTNNAESNKNSHVAKSIAKQAAIKRGTKLGAEEMNRLIDELFACAEPKFAPDGKACIKTLSLDEIGKMF
jgi:DNA mismatch repair protein MutL